MWQGLDNSVTCWAVSPSKRRSQPSALQLFGCPGYGWLKMMPIGKKQVTRTHALFRSHAGAQHKVNISLSTTPLCSVSTLWIDEKKLCFFLFFFKKKGHRLQAKQIQPMQMLKATCFCVVRSSVTITTSQLPTAGDDRKEDKQSHFSHIYGLDCSESPVSANHAVFT